MLAMLSKFLHFKQCCNHIQVKRMILISLIKYEKDVEKKLNRELKNNQSLLPNSFVSKIEHE